MNVQTYTEYEIIDSATNKSFVTRERYIALAHYKALDMVYERHITLFTSSAYTQSQTVNIMAWHLNPNFQEED